MIIDYQILEYYVQIAIVRQKHMGVKDKVIDIRKQLNETHICKDIKRG